MLNNILDRVTHLSKHMNIRRREGVYRWATSFLRPLPNSIIIGAQKSGTTSLFYYLVQHPEIVGGQPKELHFFDEHYEEGMLWYRAHFPFKKSDNITIEASPSYLFLPGVPERIKLAIPKVKLIAILRNPSERAISSYFHQVRAGRESLPIMQALHIEEKRLEMDEFQANPGFYKQNMNYLNYSYKKRGLYLQQLRRYWEVFDQSQLLILTQEKFLSEPIQTLKKVFRFLDVDTSFSDINFLQYNVGTNKHKVPDEVYDYLDSYFAPHNKELEEQLDVNLGW